ncbi:MAG: HAD family hydrolase [Candidatus Binatota bacterium]
MVMESTGNAAVFVDRDGTLIREIGYLSRLEQIEILPLVPEAIQLFHQQGLKVAVITNQSAVARGIITEDKLQQIHKELAAQLARRGAFLDGIYYCPHHPTEGMAPYRISCSCRKPNAGLAERAAAELNLDVSRSYVVGDQSSDMALAARIGAKGVLINAEGDRGHGQESGVAFLTVEDLWEAARWVIQDLRGLK